MTADILAFFGGLLALVVGGDGLVRGAGGLAKMMGISPLVVGLTVVAFGTSAPELAVSMASAFQGAAPIALGNVVGSNIFNVLLVLGSAGLVAPLVVQTQIVRFDVPVLVLASFVLAAMSLDGTISRMDGLILFIGLVTYIGWTVRAALATKNPVESDDEDEAAGSPIELALCGIAIAAIAYPTLVGAISPLQASLMIGAVVVHAAVARLSRNGASKGMLIAALFGGLALVPASADVLVTGAVGIARTMGISDAVIGLTIVAAGTSAPEAVTSFIAARRNQADLAIGGVVGSNIFNVLCIVGLTASVTDLPVPQELMHFDYPFMLAMTLGLWPLLWWRGVVKRIDGSLMLVAFSGFMAVQLWRVM